MQLYELMMGFYVKDWFEKTSVSVVGFIGAIVASLCCLGVPAVISFVSVLGLGFLLTDVILVPLLMLFLFITLMGPYLGLKHHGNPWPLILGLVAALITVVFSRLIINTWLAMAGLAGLAGASIFNTWLRSCQVQSSLSLRTECHNEKKQGLKKSA